VWAGRRWLVVGCGGTSRFDSGGGLGAGGGTCGDDSVVVGADADALRDRLARGVDVALVAGSVHGADERAVLLVVRRVPQHALGIRGDAARLVCRARVEDIAGRCAEVTRDVVDGRVGLVAAAAGRRVAVVRVARELQAVRSRRARRGGFADPDTDQVGRGGVAYPAELVGGGEAGGEAQCGEHGVRWCWLRGAERPRERRRLSLVACQTTAAIPTR